MRKREVHAGGPFFLRRGKVVWGIRRKPGIRMDVQAFFVMGIFPLIVLMFSSGV
jgi:hypothetical protein